MPKKLSKNSINELSLKINLAHGKLGYVKKFSISKNYFECEGDVNLLDDYPLLFFYCKIKINDKKKFLKIFSIKSNEKNDFLKLSSRGSLNLINKKINFDSVTINNNYKASRQDLKYFKNSFENILFNENFFEVFNLDKIKKFILEIY